MDDFEHNVFINCPFDDDYRQLLLALVEEDGHDTVDDVPIPEIIHHMNQWLADN